MTLLLNVAQVASTQHQLATLSLYSSQPFGLRRFEPFPELDLMASSRNSFRATWWQTDWQTDWL